jgi:hypothetical protein
MGLGSIVSLPVLLFSTLAVTQQITPAPELSSFALALQRRESSIDSAAFQWALSCQDEASGCPAQLSLYDACQAEYGTDYYYLYCLCTTGYHEAVHNCDYCSVTRGAIATTQYESEVSLDSQDCSSLSAQYGPNSTAPRSTSITATSASDGEADTSVTTTTDMLSGLIGTPTLPGITTTPSATASAAGPATGKVGPGRYIIGPGAIIVAALMVVFTVASSS